MRVALVSCVKTKKEGVHPARDLYASPLFRFAFDYASKHSDRVDILSAKYGLVEPTQRIKSYELTLKNMPAAMRREWAEKVAREMRQVVQPKSTLVFFCGEDYRKALLGLLSEFEQRIPLQGLSFGRQFQWYKRHQ
jgi:hypothetical protein